LIAPGTIILIAPFLVVVFNVYNHVAVKKSFVNVRAVKDFTDN
jgi:hypothetical protein